MGQLIKVIAKYKDSHPAELFFYRNESDENPAFTCKCVIGKNGIGNTPFYPEIKDLPFKKEGDMKSPLGRFPLGTAFGNDAEAVFRNINADYPYIKNHENLICVDDDKSNYYNQIIDKSNVSEIDFNSAEDMLRQDEQYQLGIMVEYNCINRLAGKGSCIFIHVWKSEEEGTAGCIAMSFNDLRQLITYFEVGCEVLITYQG